MNDEPKYLNDNDAWILAEDIPNIDFQFSQIWLSSFVNDLEKTIGINYKKVMSVYSGYNLKFYYGDKDSENVSKIILDKIINEDLGKKINVNIRKTADRLEAETLKISLEKLCKLSNSDLADFYLQLDKVHTQFYVWGWLPNAVDMFHGHFTAYLKDVLMKKINDEGEANKALAALSFSNEKSFIQEEYESLINLAILKSKNDPAFEKALAEHHKKYFYFMHQLVGKEGTTTEEYREAVYDLIKKGDPQELLKTEQKKRDDDKALAEKYSNELKLTSSEKKLFLEYAEFSFTKAYRRRVQLLWFYKMDFLFAELSKRLGITIMQSRFMMPDEVIDSLKAGEVRSELKKILEQRTQHCVYYAEKGLDIIAINQDCAKFEDTLRAQDYSNITELKGQVACVGKVVGRVKIVNTSSDINKLVAGDILVAIATNPDLVPAMKLAAAFVTEQGGITSHAAIVAREMKKPCIIGTKIATKVFKDGDMVEVNADLGIVTILKIK